MADPELRGLVRHLFGEDHRNDLLDASPQEFTRGFFGGHSAEGANDTSQQDGSRGNVVPREGSVVGPTVAQHRWTPDSLRQFFTESPR